LFNFVLDVSVISSDDILNIGKFLKAKEGWDDCGPSGSGKSYSCEDTYGFAALPGGISLSHYDVKGYLGSYGKWWSSYEGGRDGGLDGYYAVYAIYINSRGGTNYYEPSGTDKSTLLSVRCLQD
jgi:uncharacterized protein (TIGR02145 family)